MRFLSLLFASLLGQGALSQAASVNVFNLAGDGFDLALADVVGNPWSGGFIALYSFGAGSGTPPSDVAGIVANGSAGLLSSTPLLPGNHPVPGAFFAGFQFRNPGAVGSPGQYDGHDLYFMIGDGVDTASSSQILLVNLGVAPLGSDSPPPGWVGGNVRLSGNTEVIVGVIRPIVVDWSPVLGPGFENYATLSLRPIPEPTSGALLLVGGLLVIRRRGGR